jgi:hypothetical protein
MKRRGYVFAVAGEMPGNCAAVGKGTRVEPHGSSPSCRGLILTQVLFDSAWPADAEGCSALYKFPRIRLAADPISSEPPRTPRDANYDGRAPFPRR